MDGKGAKKREPTQPSIGGKPAFTGGWFVVLLCGPNSPTAHTFHNMRLINLDVPPFKDGRPDQRRQTGHIEDVAKREIIGLSVLKDMGRCEFWYNRYAICNKCKVDEVALILDAIVSIEVGI